MGISERNKTRYGFECLVMLANTFNFKRHSIFSMANP